MAEKVTPIEASLTLKDILLPLDLMLVWSGAAIYIDRGRLFKWFNYFRATYIILLSNALNLHFTLRNYHGVLYFASGVWYFSIGTYFTLITHWKRSQIQKLIQLSFKRINYHKKLLIRRLLILFIIIDAICTFSIMISFFDGQLIDYLYMGTFGEWVLCSIVLYSIIVEFIKDNDFILLSRVRQIQSESFNCQAIVIALQESQELVGLVNSVLGIIPLMLMSCTFLQAPGGITAMLKKGGKFNNWTFWLRTEGAWLIVSFVILLITFCFVGNRKSKMMEARESLIKDVSRSEIVSVDKLLAIDCLRQKIKFTAIFFEVNSTVVLSFIGSIITFTVLFIQIETAGITGAGEHYTNRTV